MPEESQERSLVPIGGNQTQMFTSLDMKRPESRKAVMKCLQDCDARITEEVNQKICVSNYFLHVVPVVNKQTGEVKDCERLVLIDKDGMTHECVSAVIINSLRSIAFAFGKPPWPDGINVTVKMKRKGEKAIYWLEPE